MAQLQARLDALGKDAIVLKQWQIETVAGAKRDVPRRTGHLGRSIVPGIITKDHASVDARTPYAAPVEFGTKAHVIRPRRARVLAWGGERRLSGRLRSGAKATHFAREVHHPGTRSRPYLIPAAKRAAGKFKDAIVSAWNDAA